MVENEFDFPIGDELKQILVIEDEELGGDELCLDQVQLIFEDRQICLTPIADTDEIKIELTTTITHNSQNSLHKSDSNVKFSESVIGKKLQGVWVCENNQGYQDQIIFAFDSLRPTLSFVVEGSVIVALMFEPLRSSNSDRNLSLQEMRKGLGTEKIAETQLLQTNSLSPENS